MSALVLVSMFGVLLVLFGAAIGAELQDRMHEGQRRRMAEQQRRVNARWRALQGRGAAVELALPSHQMLIPIAFDAEDSD